MKFKYAIQYNMMISGTKILAPTTVYKVFEDGTYMQYIRTSGHWNSSFNSKFVWIDKKTNDRVWNEEITKEEAFIEIL